MTHARRKAAVAATFVISRLVVLSIEPPNSTLAGVNVLYAFEMQRAAALGLPFYEMHARNVEEAAPNSTLDERQVEYPPLALVWMAMPTWFLEPIPKYGLVPDWQTEAAKRASRIALFVVDLCGFGLLMYAGAGAAQLAVHTAAGVLLFPLLYERLDLVLGVLLLAALVMLARKLAAWAPLLALAVAINFKLTPLVLTPLFVMEKIGRRLALLSALTAAVFLPFVAKDGVATLGFLRYHAVRGLQLESVWSTIPVVQAALSGTPANVRERFGAFEVESGISGALQVLASLAMAAAIPAFAVVLWKMPPREPRLYLRYAVAFLLAAIAVSKVFSPQYLLWLAPLVVLWDGRRASVVWAAFLATCALTTICYPFGYGRLLDAVNRAGQLPLATRLAGVAPLAARNLLLVGLTIWCWRDMAPAAQAGKIPGDARRDARAARRTRAR